MAQAAIVGGVDENGDDAVNDLTYIFLDVMEESGLRDPNYQARIHPGAPERYVLRAVDVARKGNGVSALFNDEASISALLRHGYPLKEARNYGVVGCVELACRVRAFSRPMPRSSICPYASSSRSTGGDASAEAPAWEHIRRPPRASTVSKTFSGHSVHRYSIW